MKGNAAVVAIERGAAKLVAAGFVLLAAACSSSTSSERSAEPLHVAAGQPSPLFRSPEEPGAAAADDSTQQADAGDPEGIASLVDGSPRLQALRENVARTTGLILQGSFAPNPVLMLETEMMPIDDMGFGNARNKIRISQRFELAGKADARVTLAEYRRDEAEALYFHERSSLLAEVAGDCCSILIKQGEAEALKRLVELRASLTAIAAEMNATGRLSDLEFIPFEVALDRSRVALSEVEAEREMLLRQVEGLLGLPDGSVTAGVDGGGTGVLLFEEPAGGESDVLSRSSQLIVDDRKVAAERAGLELSRSGAWPDLTAGIGYARGSEMSSERDDFVGAFVEIPLPLIDRNQGATRSAEAAVRQAESTLLADAHRLLGEWRGLKQRWEKLSVTRDLYTKKIIPGLERELSLMDSQVVSGRIPLMKRIEAAVALEETVLAALKIDESLVLIQVEARRLTGLEQRWAARQGNNESADAGDGE